MPVNLKVPVIQYSCCHAAYISDRRIRVSDHGPWALKAHQCRQVHKTNKKERATKRQRLISRTFSAPHQLALEKESSVMSKEIRASRVPKKLSWPRRKHHTLPMLKTFRPPGPPAPGRPPPMLLSVLMCTARSGRSTREEKK